MADHVSSIAVSRFTTETIETRQARAGQVSLEPFYHSKDNRAAALRKRFQAISWLLV
jgi:hypothetical protein